LGIIGFEPMKIKNQKIYSFSPLTTQEYSLFINLILFYFISNTKIFFLH